MSLLAGESITVQGVGIVRDDFYAVIHDPKARAILGDSPYRLAYDLAMIQCAWAMKQLRGGDLVSFVCDEHNNTVSSLPRPIEISS